MFQSTACPFSSVTVIKIVTCGFVKMNSLIVPLSVTYFIGSNMMPE